MQNLAKKEYWDSVYQPMGPHSHEEETFLKKAKNWVKNQTRDYSNFIMWERVVPKYLKKDNSLKIIEIGCAPGKYLINFSKQYSYNVFGVEYSEKGLQITKNNFISEGLNPENVIKADFFDKDFHSNYHEKFDLVFSRGFIEHYDDVKSVVDLHLSLIKKGGLVIVSIPNLSGLNKFFGKFFNIDSYNLHNTSIMSRKSFSELFDPEKVEMVFCDYVGVFSFGLFNTNRRWKYFLHRVLLIVQRPFDFLLRILFDKPTLRSKYSSPYLMFIGRKK